MWRGEKRGGEDRIVWVLTWRARMMRLAAAWRCFLEGFVVACRHGVAADGGEWRPIAGDGAAWRAVANRWRRMAGGDGAV